MVKFLLITDLDNTLVGDNTATVTLNNHLASMGDQVSVIYATGRSLNSARQLQSERQLLEPNFWVTGVGTEIYHQDSLDQSWADNLSKYWQREAIANLAQSITDLQLQEPEEQNPWKISYYVEPNEQAINIVNDLKQQLKTNNLQAQVVFSSNQDVDILPANGNKGLAITYLRERLEIPENTTVVCGDSGNDISLFEQSTLGVIVNNARNELRDWFNSNKHPRLYFADSEYAWGILEGLKYFKLLDT